MKKLTPFQKKVARWFPSIRAVQNFEGIVFLAILGLGSGTILKVAVISESGFLTAIVMILAIIAMTAVIIRVDSLKSYWNQLSETQAAKAEEFAKEHPKYAKRIGELIQEVFAQDDGGEIQEKLEIFKTLANKERCFAQIPSQIENLKTEIAALEKELGLGERRKNLD